MPFWTHFCSHRKRKYEKAQAVVISRGSSDWKPHGLLKGIHKVARCV